MEWGPDDVALTTGPLYEILHKKIHSPLIVLFTIFLDGFEAIRQVNKLKTPRLIPNKV